MTEPTTALDPRYSDAGTKPTSWADTLETIRSAELFWITTVRRDGRPHVTPLVAVWLDDALHFCTGDSEQKALNLAANPNVTLTTGSNGWEDGLDVVVEGRSEPVTDRPTLERLAEAWRTKWDGQWRFEVTEGRFRHPEGPDSPDDPGPTVYSVAPTKVLAFGKGAAFTHTSHRF